MRLLTILLVAGSAYGTTTLAFPAITGGGNGVLFNYSGFAATIQPGDNLTIDAGTLTVNWNPNAMDSFSQHNFALPYIVNGVSRTGGIYLTVGSPLFSGSITFNPDRDVARYVMLEFVNFSGPSDGTSVALRLRAYGGPVDAPEPATFALMGSALAAALLISCWFRYKQVLNYSRSEEQNQNE